MTKNRIVIVGLGLMGASLALACRKTFPKADVIGVSRNKASLNRAKRKKMITSGFFSLNEAIQGPSLVILCSPVDIIPKQLHELDALGVKSIVVTDVGSVKGHMQDEIKKKWKNLHFVSSHPMVGSHKQGIESADACLYEGGMTYMIRRAGENKRAVQQVKSFWKRLKCEVKDVSVREHDVIVAQISHLPHLIAAGLVNSIPAGVLGAAGKGFKDSTRVAQGDVRIWDPILKANRDNMLQIISQFDHAWSQLKVALRKSKTRDLSKLLGKAAQKRSKI